VSREGCFKKFKMAAICVVLATLFVLIGASEIKKVSGVFC
jgi:hypothetical protein